MPLHFINVCVIKSYIYALFVKGFVAVVEHSVHCAKVCASLRLQMQSQRYYTAQIKCAVADPKGPRPPLFPKHV